MILNQELNQIENKEQYLSQIVNAQRNGKIDHPDYYALYTGYTCQHVVYN